jgi:hypothetical protein
MINESIPADDELKPKRLRYTARLELPRSQERSCGRRIGLEGAESVAAQANTAVNKEGLSFMM